MGFWRRACASVVDGVCILVILIPTDAVRRWLIASGDVGEIGARAFAVGEHLLVLAYVALSRLQRDQSSIGKPGTLRKSAMFRVTSTARELRVIEAIFKSIDPI